MILTIRKCTKSKLQKDSLNFVQMVPTTFSYQSCGLKTSGYQVIIIQELTIVIGRNCGETTEHVVAIPGLCKAATKISCVMSFKMIFCWEEENVLTLILR